MDAGRKGEWIVCFECLKSWWCRVATYLKWPTCRPPENACSSHWLIHRKMKKKIVWEIVTVKTTCAHTYLCDCCLRSNLKKTKRLTWSIQKKYWYDHYHRPPARSKVTVVTLHRHTRLHSWVTRRVGQLLPMSGLTPNVPLTYDPSD